MNLVDDIKDIKKEIFKLRKAVFTLIKEFTKGFKEITRVIVGSIKQPEPMKDDCWGLYL